MCAVPVNADINGTRFLVHLVFEPRFTDRVERGFFVLN